MEAFHASAPDILPRFAFTSLPLIRPEVPLRCVDGALLTEHDLTGTAKLGHENITFGRAHAAEQSRRKSDLAVAAKDEKSRRLCHVGRIRMRLFAEPLPAKLVWDEGELVALVVAGHRHTVVEQMRRWRVEADWWKEGVSRDYVTLRTADGLVCDVYGDRRSGAWWLQRVID
jgi:hypothetical protein